MSLSVRKCSVPLAVPDAKIVDLSGQAVKVQALAGFRAALGDTLNLRPLAEAYR
ncbi:hypothetical protein AB0B25_28990 [Nocardia sp. NPDC049190]|uniref:hypothetical protein n=1 Tax=Nocardia sp. NPDC049190 TaxID=3155650 RepID=UPI00340D05EE